MSNIIVKENETLDSALRRFKRSCAKAGIQQEIRKREHYDVRRNPKRLENVNITKQTEVLGIYYQGLVFYPAGNFCQGDGADAALYGSCIQDILCIEPKAGDQRGKKYVDRWNTGK